MQQYFRFLFLFSPNVACFRAVTCHVSPLSRPFILSAVVQLEKLMPCLFCEHMHRSPHYVPRRVWPSGWSLWRWETTQSQEWQGVQPVFEMSFVGPQIFADTPTLATVCGLKHSKVLISSKPKAKSRLNLSRVEA